MHMLCPHKDESKDFVGLTKPKVHSKKYIFCWIHTWISFKLNTEIFSSLYLCHWTTDLILNIYVSTISELSSSMRIYRILNNDFLEYTDLTGFKAMVAICPR